jgi:hypothetical protein
MYPDNDERAIFCSSGNSKKLNWVLILYMFMVDGGNVANIHEAFIK